MESKTQDFIFLVIFCPRTPENWDFLLIFFSVTFFFSDFLILPNKIANKEIVSNIFQTMLNGLLYVSYFN